MSMSYRQHVALRELKEMQEAEAREIREREERERFERERPVREATEALQATARELGKLTREKIRSGVDAEFVASLDPETKAMKMPWSEATEYNRSQIALFLQQRPDVYWSSANIATIGDYFQRNHIQIVGAKILEAAWDRLSSYGLLESAPTESAPEPEPITARVEVDPEQEKIERWERYTTEIVAKDPATGKRYTQYQLDRCSAEEFRKVMFGARIPKTSTVIYATR